MITHADVFMLSFIFMEKRLQKILSERGIASRRNAEDLIFEGRVTVNGRVATIGTKADPSRDSIKVDGKLLIKEEPKVYLIFNKPRGVITSLHDPEKRMTVKDFLKDIKYRIFPVGRLDYDSEGMLFITNDGEFAHAVLRPSNKIPKTYHVKVRGVLEEWEIETLRKGVKLKDGITAPSKVLKIRKFQNNSWLEMTIHEGRKRQIRRMLEEIGHPVLRLKRIRIDGINMGKLVQGTYRYLTFHEISKIKFEIGLSNKRNNC